MKKLLLLILLQSFSHCVFALNVTIIESQSFLSGHDMDVEWNNVINGMGYTSTISPQSTLDNNTFFANTDILIVSSGVIMLTANRVNTILQFIQTGKPVYLQSEYLPAYSTNIAFDSLVTWLGGTFSWSTLFSGDLQPMNVLGSYSTTNNTVNSIGYYWYSVSGIGDCNTVNILEYGGAYHGFQYVPANPAYGSIITTTDQDWVRTTTSPQLMENIITHLITPPVISNSLAVNIGNDTTLCAGATVTLDATNANATYLWQNNSSGATFNVTQPGTYWVQVTSSCGTATDTIVVNYNPAITINLGNDTTVCAGATFTLDVTTANASYLWQDNSSNPSFNVTQAGIYWVQMTVNNCSTADTIDVNYISVPAVNFGSDTTLCPGAILTLDATSANAVYLWQNNSSNPTYNVTQSGIYWVQASNTCGTATDTITVSYTPALIINLGNDTTLCPGATFTLDVTNSNASYLWQDNTSSPTYFVMQPGIYWVQVSNSCENISDTINVYYTPALAIGLGNDTTLCPGVTLTLDVTNANASYLWQNNSSNPTYNVTQAGTYWAQVSNSCETISDTINVNYSQPMAINLGNDTTLCPGATFTLVATNTNASYLWQDNSSNPIYNVTQAGTYWVQVSNSCETISDTINVNYNQALVIDLGNDTTLCTGATFMLDVTNANASYLWQNNSSSPMYNVTQAGIYWVQVSNSCETISDTINVNYNQPLAINLGNDTVLCPGATFMLDVTNANASYLWQNNSSSPAYNVTQGGIYWVQVSNSCEAISDTINVELKNCEIILEMPNVFTPNNDGANDYFAPIKAEGIEKATLIIYNKWGRKLFESTDIIAGWNGKYNSENCTSATYYWIINYVDIIGKHHSSNGFLTLIK